MRAVMQNKLCVGCGKKIGEYFEHTQNIITGDLEKVCIKCAKILPKLKHISIEELDNA